MYAEADLLLALIKDDDWLSEPAERVYEEHADELWTTHLTLIELMLVAYREDRNVERIVTNASTLLEIRGNEERILAAASYVSDRGLTPFDALHAVVADGEPIVSSDQSYDGVCDRIPLEEQ